MLVFRYNTGEEIKKNDHIRHDGVDGRVELVATSLDDPEGEWYVREYGGGITIVDGKCGRIFFDRDDIANYEDLEFVARANSEPVRYADLRLAAFDFAA